MRLISFSLWGTNLKYLLGAIENVKICKSVYPEYTCRFYYDTLVPFQIIFRLQDLGAETIPMNRIADYSGSVDRFQAVNDADIVLIRDCDSRPTIREREAVDEWIKSDKLYHAMFDHPAHQFWMIGLTGFKKSDLNVRALSDQFVKRDYYGVDYEFFQSFYDKIKGDLLIHDGCEYRGLPFPSRRKGLEFCGKVFNEDGSTVQEHEDTLRRYEDKLYKTVYVYHHLGLGDCLDCNAIIRLLAKQDKYYRIFVFAKKKHYATVSYVYRDNPAIVVIPIPNLDSYDDEYKFVKQFSNGAKEFLEIGHRNYPWEKEKELNMGCAEIFYSQLNIPFEKRFTEWYFERDLEEEDRVYKKLNPSDERYLFIHDDPSRGYVIDDEKALDIFGDRVKIIRNDMSENLLHFGKVLENAEEIHIIESSFKSLVEVLDVKGKCYFHNIRTGASSLLGKTRQKWQEIK